MKAGTVFQEIGYSNLLVFVYAFPNSLGIHVLLVIRVVLENMYLNQQKILSVHEKEWILVTNRIKLRSNKWYSF